MTYSVRVKNGDSYMDISFYECVDCHREVCESDPHTILKNRTVLCEGCSFKRGIITERQFLDTSGFLVSSAHAAIHNGKVEIWSGNRAPWERNVQDIRRTAAYQKWRKAVFERDNYTCQICGQVGGRLNAHHVKPFAEFPAFRLDVSNGSTLCESCHRNVHRKRKVQHGERGVSNKQRNI